MLIMHDSDILKAFNSGEWCKSDDICRILGITFKEAFHKYEFSRTAEWNPYPLHGQLIICYFKRPGV